MSSCVKRERERERGIGTKLASWFCSFKKSQRHKKSFAISFGVFFGKIFLQIPVFPLRSVQFRARKILRRYISLLLIVLSFLHQRKKKKKTTKNFIKKLNFGKKKMVSLIWYLTIVCEKELFSFAGSDECSVRFLRECG